jgi:hypothetical protein
MKTYGGMDIEIHAFFISALAGGEWSASRRGRFTPGERDPGTNWIGGWVDCRICLEDMGTRKILRQLEKIQEISPHASGSLSGQPSLDLSLTWTPVIEEDIRRVKFRPGYIYMGMFHCYVGALLTLLTQSSNEQ